MRIEEIVSLIERALAYAPAMFEAAANGTSGSGWEADRMPESWIVACLMKAALDVGLSALPEVRVNHDVIYFESKGAPIQASNVDVLRGAKIDLLLAEKSQVPGLARLRVALEMKGPKSNWQSFRWDIVRLTEIARLLRDNDQAAMFAYVSGRLLAHEHLVELNRLEKFTGIRGSDFSIIPKQDATNPLERYSKVYMYTMYGGKGIDA